MKQKSLDSAFIDVKFSNYFLAFFLYASCCCVVWCCVVVERGDNCEESTQKEEIGIGKHANEIMLLETSQQSSPRAFTFSHF
jgi:hypothetical protein